MRIVKIWNKKRGDWFYSNNGKGIWSTIGKAEAVMKTAHFPECGCHRSDYEFVVFECHEVSRVET